jgi:hypothetical protein
VALIAAGPAFPHGAVKRSLDQVAGVLFVVGVEVDAILYSVDSMTTRGASGLTLPRRWQLMGALEAADGVLLSGAPSRQTLSERLLPRVAKD